ncbi:MAG: glycosyltransferase, partial [Anaerolineae bacterium]|nr:glycosyltransferase [Anaerolineae bacterium]
SWAIRPLETPLSRLVFAPAFRRADLLLSISGYTRDWLARLINHPHVEVLPGGVNVEPFEQPAQADLPAWVGREPVALSVGIVKPRKGQHITLEAVALARQQIPNLHYAMAGTLDAAPEYVEGLRRRAEELGIADYVHFLGQLPPYGALTAWFQRSDVFILASTSVGSSFEGLGFVFLEAGAAGTPGIGTLDSGITEAIVDGETGYLVPQNDVGATAEALVKVLRDPARRAQMGEAARRFARERSWENLARRVVGHYHALLAR